MSAKWDGRDLGPPACGFMADAGPATALATAGRTGLLAASLLTVAAALMPRRDVPPRAARLRGTRMRTVAAVAAVLFVVVRVTPRMGRLDNLGRTVVVGDGCA